MTTVRNGDLVYLDSFSGLVPAKLLAHDGEYATVRITGTRGAYRRGDVTTFGLRYVVPRNHVYYRFPHFRIGGNWTFA